MTIATDKPLYVIVFLIGNEHFAIPMANLVEVLPLLALKPLPKTPEWVAGWLNYRGTPVLVLDLSSLVIGKPCKAIVSTRILLAPVRMKDGGGKILGLVAEGVTETVKLMPDMLRAGEIWNKNAPYLGMLAMYKGEILQIIQPDKILTAESAILLELAGEA